MCRKSVARCKTPLTPGDDRQAVVLLLVNESADVNARDSKGRSARYEEPVALLAV